MKTPMHALLVALAFGACSHPEVAPAPTPTELLVAETPIIAQPAEKTYAPFLLRLTSSARVGKAEVVLTIDPQANVPNAHARILLPPGVEFVSGATEADLGAQVKGQTSKLAVRVVIPDGAELMLAGGVEVEAGTGRKLARSITLRVGNASKKDDATIIKLPEGGAVHVQ